MLYGNPNWCSLVKQHSHLCGQQCRPGCMFQHVTYLGQGNTGEPLNKLMDRGVFFEVLEERGNRNPCAPENPSTTYAIRVAFDIGASRPINHGWNVSTLGGEGKGNGSWPFVVSRRNVNSEFSLTGILMVGLGG